MSRHHSPIRAHIRLQLFVPRQQFRRSYFIHTKVVAGHQLPLLIEPGLNLIGIEEVLLRL